MSKASELINKILEISAGYGKDITVNGYSVMWNPLWKKWQVSHPNIGARIAEFDSKEDAIEYSEKG